MEGLEPDDQTPWQQPPDGQRLPAQPPIVIGGAYETDDPDVPDDDGTSGDQPDGAVEEGEAPGAHAPLELEPVPPPPDIAEADPEIIAPPPPVVEYIEDDEPLEATEAAATEGAEATDTAELGEARPQDIIKFRVVEVAHNTDTARRAAQALDGCRTVAFELAGGSPEQRGMVETLLNTMRDPEAGEDISTQAEALLRQASSSLDEIIETTKRLPESVEKITLFDMDNTHPDYYMIEENNAAAQRLVEGLAEHASNYELNDAQYEVVRSLAVAALVREPLMADQLEALAAREAANGPGLVGVVTGMLHTVVKQDLANRGFETTATPPIDSRDPSLRPPKITNDLIAQLLADPDETLSAEAYDRALLESIARWEGVDAYAAAATAELLPPAALEATLEAIDAAKHPTKEHAEISRDIKAILTQAQQQIDPAILKEYFRASADAIAESLKPWRTSERIVPKEPEDPNRGTTGRS